MTEDAPAYEPRRKCAYDRVYDCPNFAVPGLHHRLGWVVCADHEDPEEAMPEPTTTIERNAEAQAVERDIATIDQALDHLRRVTADTRMRYTNARAAAADLAASVHYFLDDPEGVGTDALRRAVERYGQQGAGNFTDSAREAVGG